MAYVLVKSGKFMEGYSYSTLRGYSFNWTKDEEKALRLSDDDPSVDFFKNATGSRIERRDNNRRELRKLGRERSSIRAHQHRPPSIHDRINARANARPTTHTSDKPKEQA